MEYLDFLLNIDLEKYLDSFEYIDKRDKERYEYLIKCLDKSIVKLYKKDKVLLENSVHEQSISHKLGCYLQNNIEEEKTGLFEVFSVDCEYDKDMEKAKDRKKFIYNPKPDIIDGLKQFELEDETKEELKKMINDEDFFCDKKIDEFEKKLNEILPNETEKIEKYIKQIRQNIRPDIIVHEREKNENNLLVIEIKKVKFNEDLVKLEEADIDKLKRITLQIENRKKEKDMIIKYKNEKENRALTYKFGIFINFGNHYNNKTSGNNSNIKKEVSFRIVLIINGKEVTHWICKKTKECIKIE